MSVEVLDGATIREFVEDDAAFMGSVRDLFCSLDTNHDGLLSYSEIMEELRCLRLREIHFGVDVDICREELLPIYNSIFLQFDHDQNGTVDVREFTEEMKKILLAMADGLGFLPVQMVVEEGSLLKKAVERELGKTPA